METSLMQGKIRKANADDVSLMSEIACRSKAHWGYSTEFMAACRAELSVTPERISADAFTYWVYELNANVVGFYAIEVLSPNEAELDALFVLPENIGQGIGKSLLQHALNYAKNQGVSKVNVQSDPHAEAFYLAAGGTLIGKQPSGSIAGRYLPVLAFDLA